MKVGNNNPHRLTGTMQCLPADLAVFFAVLSLNIVAACKDFSPQRTQRFAQRNAEQRWLCGLCELLRGLCVKSEGSESSVVAPPRCVFALNSFSMDSV